MRSDEYYATDDEHDYQEEEPQPSEAPKLAPKLNPAPASVEYGYYSDSEDEEVRQQLEGAERPERGDAPTPKPAAAAAGSSSGGIPAGAPAVATLRPRRSPSFARQGSSGSGGGSQPSSPRTPREEAEAVYATQYRSLEKAAAEFGTLGRDEQLKANMAAVAAGGSAARQPAYEAGVEGKDSEEEERARAATIVHATYRKSGLSFRDQRRLYEERLGAAKKLQAARRGKQARQQVQEERMRATTLQARQQAREQQQRMAAARGRAASPSAPSGSSPNVSVGKAGAVLEWGSTAAPPAVVPLQPAPQRPSKSSLVAKKAAKWPPPQPAPSTSPPPRPEATAVGVVPPMLAEELIDGADATSRNDAAGGALSPAPHPQRYPSETDAPFVIARVQMAKERSSSGPLPPASPLAVALAAKGSASQACGPTSSADAADATSGGHQLPGRDVEDDVAGGDDDDEYDLLYDGLSTDVPPLSSTDSGARSAAAVAAIVGPPGMSPPAALLGDSQLAPHARRSPPPRPSQPHRLGSTSRALERARAAKAAQVEADAREAARDEARASAGADTASPTARTTHGAARVINVAASKDPLAPSEGGVGADPGWLAHVERTSSQRGEEEADARRRPGAAGAAIDATHEEAAIQAVALQALRAAMPAWDPLGVGAALGVVAVPKAAKLRRAIAMAQSVGVAAETVAPAEATLVEVDRQEEARAKVKARKTAEKRLRAAMPPPLLPFAPVADPTMLHTSIVAARTAGVAEATVAAAEQRLSTAQRAALASEKAAAEKAAEKVAADKVAAEQAAREAARNAARGAVEAARAEAEAAKRAAQEQARARAQEKVRERAAARAAARAAEAQRVPAAPSAWDFLGIAEMRHESSEGSGWALEEPEQPTLTREFAEIAGLSRRFDPFGLTAMEDQEWAGTASDASAGKGRAKDSAKAEAAHFVGLVSFLANKDGGSGSKGGAPAGAPSGAALQARAKALTAEARRNAEAQYHEARREKAQGGGASTIGGGASSSVDLEIDAALRVIEAAATPTPKPRPPLETVWSLEKALMEEGDRMEQRGSRPAPPPNTPTVTASQTDAAWKAAVAGADGYEYHYSLGVETIKEAVAAASPVGTRPGKQAAKDAAAYSYEYYEEVQPRATATEVVLHKSDTTARIGLTLMSQSDDEPPRIKAIAPGTLAAAAAGLERGMALLSVDGRPIQGHAEGTAALKAATGNVLLTVVQMSDNPATPTEEPPVAWAPSTALLRANAKAATEQKANAAEEVDYEYYYYDDDSPGGGKWLSPLRSPSLSTVAEEPTLAASRSGGGEDDYEEDGKDSTRSYNHYLVRI